MEACLKLLSSKIFEQLSNRGKTSRDLFNTFSKETLGYLNVEEFILMMNFVLDGKVEEAILGSIFSVF